MFGLFKKKSEEEVLQKKYKKLMEEAHRLSKTNRKLSDDKVYEADQILQQIDKLKQS
ncbi:MAG: Lacal_2735 family protein [Bacteroidota bacterium]